LTLLQAALHLSDKKTLATLPQLVTESIQVFQHKFKECYQQQIQMVHEGYAPLEQSEDAFDREKYKIFKEFFIN
jgi:hypothetical protein